jgi:vesicle coat complex subunit
LLPVLGGVMVLLSGCAVNNQYIAKLPLFEAKSDRIPGLDPPHVRTKLIREKGVQGATASEDEREILVAQLVYEYQTSPDPNMRREAVDALAKIPHSQRDRFLQEILQDPNPFVRLSALEAMSKTYSGDLADLQALLISRMKTDQDKDVRLTAIRLLGNVTPQDKAGGGRHSQAVAELGHLLHDRVPAVRYESMQSLHKITGKDYGNDINRWLQYIRYLNGEIPNLPAERSFTEKLPTVSLPMFK